MELNSQKSTLLLIIITFFAISCNNDEALKDNNDPTAFRAPVTISYTLAPPQPIKWEITDPDSIGSPKTYPLDIDKLPSQPFSINEFKPLKSPMEKTPLNMDPNNRIPLQFDTISIEPKTSILPTPLVTSMERPQILEGTSSGFLQLSMKEGLPSNEIRKIIQNEDGTYWIATFEGGLCLYDGNELYTYDYKRIWDIEKDLDGKLWVATDNNGIFVLDFKKKVQTHFLANTTILTLQCDHQNQMWIIQWRKGTYVVDSEMRQLRQITNPGFEGGFPLMEDRDHNIWLGHSINGQNTISVIGKDRTDYSDIVNRVGGIFFQGSDMMWIATGTGAEAISLENKTITPLNEKNGLYGTTFFYEEDNQGRLWIIKNDTIQVLSKDQTQMKTIVTNSPVSLPAKFGCSLKDKRGVIWIGTLTNGILLVDPVGPLSEHLDESAGLMNSEIWSFEEDHRGDIWMGSRAGLNIYSPSSGTIKSIDHSTLKNPSNSSNLFCIKEFDKDKIFIDGQIGFTIIDREEKLMTRYIDEQNIATQIIDAIKDEEGTYWLATARGLAVYDPELNWLKVIPNSSPQIAAGRTRFIVEDGLGHYWLGTTNGLVIIDPENNTIQHLREQEGLCNNDVMQIIMREDGKLWVATFNGISIIDPVDQSITNLGEAEGLIPDEVYELQEKKGTLYIGSVNGLIQVKPPSDLNTPWNFYNYAAPQGFPSNDYKQDASLLLSNGQLWFGTSPVDKLTILTQDPAIDTTPCQVSIVGLSIMDDNLSFENKASLDSYIESGDTLVPSNENQNLSKNELPKDPGYVIENNIRWDSLSSLYKVPIGLKLPYDQNYLRFRYANLCVLDRDKITFRYILDGKDKLWTYNSDETESKNYFNLQPGSYTFKVSTKRGLSRWSDPAEFSFRIFPPWWRTWWAYLIYTLLAIGGIRTIVQYRSRKLKKENRLLEEKVAQRTTELRETIVNLQSTQAQLIQSEKMASLGELTAGIAHEIQNPLNFVNNFSEVSTEMIEEVNEALMPGSGLPDMEEAKEILQDLKGNLEKITHHGQRASGIVRNMLDHSRNSGGEKVSTDINILCDEYLRLAYHGMRAKDRNFNADFETMFDESLPKVFVIPQDIGRVLLNLINNAFQACADRGVSAVSEMKSLKAMSSLDPKVEVSTKNQGDQLEITISDNGPGIPDEIRDKIFQPFFTTKPTGKGTGLGLSLSYDIVKAHGGTISVNSQVGQGTVFIIKLPISNQ